MKKTVNLIILIMTFACFVSAQNEYIPFAKSNKFWFYTILNSDDTNPASVGAFVVWIKGDTIIKNQNYVKVYSSGLSGSHPCQFPPCFVPDVPYSMGPGSLIGFVRDDTLSRKVYYKKINLEWNDCAEEETELYNFSETVDSIPACLKSKILSYWGGEEFGSIDSIRETEEYHRERKILHFKAPYLFNGLPFISEMQIIEGIGSTFYNPFTQFENIHFAGFCEGNFEDCKVLQIDSSEFKVGDTWTYTDHVDGPCMFGAVVKYSIIDDSLIGNKLYSILAASSDNFILEESKVLLFKKNNKISFLENGKEFTLYDFNVKENDIVEFYIPSNFQYYREKLIDYYDVTFPIKQKLKIIKIDSVLSIENKWIKKFTTENIEGEDTCFNMKNLYEGIGSSFGMFGNTCIIRALDECFGNFYCFSSKNLNLNFLDFICNPELISFSKYNKSTSWTFTPFNLELKEEIIKIRPYQKILIGNKLCYNFAIFKNLLPDLGSKLMIYYNDSLVEFYDGNKFKTLYDFRQKNIGDTVKYYLPWNAKYYDISSGQGQFSPDTNAYFYKVTGIENIKSDEGTVLKKYEIENFYEEFSCYTMGSHIIESIGSTSGFLGRPCMQLPSGFPEYFRCFKSENLNYNALDKDCELTSTNELNAQCKVYPNPVNNSLMIETDVTYDHVSVIDLNGVTVINDPHPSTEIEVSELKNGIYILALGHKNQVSSKTKIVILK